MKPAAPSVYRPIQLSPQTRPATPPVYRPQAPPKILQLKPAIPAQLRMPAAGLRPPVAPPVYKPHPRPHAVQPKPATAFRAATIQLASEKKSSGYSACDATVTSGSVTGTGSYVNSIHGEINALEDYLNQGGTLGAITKIEISSPPCKYCHLILVDLGILGKVTVTKASKRRFGSCQGGSYGFFKHEGVVSKALQAQTGLSQDDYLSSLSKRKSALK
jgi:deoxycytidylate deaminase